MKKKKNEQLFDFKAWKKGLDKIKKGFKEVQNVINKAGKK